MLRTGSLRLPLSLLLPALFLTLFEPDDGLNAFIALTYYVLPMAMVPFAAIQGARDRDTALRGARTTTPLLPQEAFTASFTALCILWTFSLVSTFPLYIAALSAAPMTSLIQLGPVLLLALLLGWTGAASGLLIVHALGDRRRLVLAGGFLLPLVWILPTGDLRSFAGTGATPGSWLVESFLYANPFAWASTADSPGPMLDQPGLVFGVVSVGAWAILLAGMIFLTLRHHGAWYRPPKRARRFSIVLALLILLPAVAAGTTSLLSPVETEELPSGELEIPGESRWLEWHMTTEPFATPLTEQTRFVLRLAVIGEPLETVRLTDLRVTSDAMQYEVLEPQPPLTLRLDSVRNDTTNRWRDDGGAIGVNSTEVQLLATADSLTPRVLRSAVDLRLDGDHLSLPTVAFVTWKLPKTPVLVTALASAICLETGARILPARWNQW